MSTRHRSRIAIVTCAVAVLLLGVAIFSAGRSFGLFSENVAETGFRPLADALSGSGANRVCEQGDAGFGPDNSSPWYKAVFAAPASIDLTDEVTRAAARQGFVLSSLRIAAPGASQKLYQGTSSNRTLTIAVYQHGASMNTCAGSTTASSRSSSVELTLEYPSNTTGKAAPVEVQSTEPAPDPHTWYDQKFGTYVAVAVTGLGSSTVALPAGARSGLLTITHAGSNRFRISAVDAGGTSTGEEIVDTVGDYSGVTAFGVPSTGAIPSTLLVDTDGPWSITLSPLADALPLGVAAEGSGDRVFRYDGPNRDLALRSTGSSLFEIRQIKDPGAPLIVAFEDTGVFSGSGSISEGPSIVVVHSNGDWTIR